MPRVPRTLLNRVYTYEYSSIACTRQEADGVHSEGITRLYCVSCGWGALFSSSYELDIIFLLGNIVYMWDVAATDEYLEWFRSQDPDAQAALLSKALLLEEFGPQLGCPLLL